MKLRTSLTILAIAFAAVSCGDDEESVATTGSLSVVTATTGEEIDADGYVVTVDGVDRATVGANSSTTIPDLLAGTYSVGLAGIALNCYQPASDNVSVTAGQTESIQFDVYCGADNQLPVADAGDTQTLVDEDDAGSVMVTLDGSSSTDEDGTIAHWIWSVNRIEIGTGETLTLPVPIGVHTVTLTVQDDLGGRDSDEVTITVEAAGAPNALPFADAGGNQSVEDADDSGDETVTLDGSGSTDADGTIVSWSWSENGVEFGTGETLDAAFDVGIHTVTLTVEDDQGDSDLDSIRITVERAGAPNLPPVADAGENQWVADADDSGDETVTLDGSGSTDEGTIVSWTWSENGGEIGTGETLDAVFDVGAHTVTLTVEDDLGGTDTDDVTITVESGATNAPPTANAGGDWTLQDFDNNAYEELLLNGSGSTDSDGTIKTWNWSVGGETIGTGEDLTVQFPLGEHTVTLTVTDDGGATDSDEAIITVTGATVSEACTVLACGLDDGLANECQRRLDECLERFSEPECTGLAVLFCNVGNF